jgi:hypothetical protein
MTQYEIIQMANEAGLNSYRIAPAEAVAVWERFAALVAAKEREACADIVDGADTPDCGGWTACGISEAIRARSTT